MITKNHNFDLHDTATKTKREYFCLLFQLPVVKVLLGLSLTSWQTDGSTDASLHVVFRADVNVLLAQPPQAKVGCLTGLIGFVRLRAQHCPVVRYHSREHASHTHQQHEDGNLYLCTLVHVSR